MRELLFVFLGGGIGSVLRYGIKLVQTHLSLNPISTLGQTIFPWPTMVANVLGCLLIGGHLEIRVHNLVTGTIQDRFTFPPRR